jgi:hypothetical protein
LLACGLVLNVEYLLVLSLLLLVLALSIAISPSVLAVPLFSLVFLV